MTTMTADNVSNYTRQTRIIAALAEARKARHHPTCNCRHFDRLYCNPADALWQRAINRELDQLTTRDQPQHNQT